MHYSTIKRPVHKFKTDMGKSIVEDSGYIPSKIKIEGMMRAGLRLDHARDDYYDSLDGKDDFITVGRRRVYYDRVEAAEIGNETKKKLDNTKKLRRVAANVLKDREDEKKFNEKVDSTVKSKLEERAESE